MENLFAMQTYSTNDCVLCFIYDSSLELSRFNLSWGKMSAVCDHLGICQRVSGYYCLSIQIYIPFKTKTTWNFYNGVFSQGFTKCFRFEYSCDMFWIILVYHITIKYVYRIQRIIKIKSAILQNYPSNPRPISFGVCNF